MIACSCRSFIRVAHARKFANSYSISNNFLHFFQSCGAYHHLSNNKMDRNKKQRTSKRAWRPISTQSSQGDDKSELGVQVQVGQCSDSSEIGETSYRVAQLSISKMNEYEEEEEGSARVEDVKVDGAQLDSQSERHSVSVEVSASLFRFIIGKGGSTQKQIEEETTAKVIFPSSKTENSIVIEGDSIESITKASQIIQVILEEAVKSPNLDYSHFISLPLAIHPGLVDKLMNFQNSILGMGDPNQGEKVFNELDGDTSEKADNNGQQLDGRFNVPVKLKVDNETEHAKMEMKKIPVVSHPPKASKASNLSDLGIDKSIFIKPKTFHLTVLMLKLWNNERIAAATEVLQRVSSKVMDALEGKPVTVRLKGLECMKGSLAKARVLYTPVEVIGGEDRLLRACQVITDAYIEAGLVLEKDAGQKLKLHGTVMNARHRKRMKRTSRFDSFDARSIFEKYGSEDWGEYIIPEVHLSQRFVFDESGYYHRCTSIPFPENEQDAGDQKR